MLRSPQLPPIVWEPRGWACTVLLQSRLVYNCFQRRRKFLQSAFTSELIGTAKLNQLKVEEPAAPTSHLGTSRLGSASVNSSLVAHVFPAIQIDLRYTATRLLWTRKQAQIKAMLILYVFLTKNLGKSADFNLQLSLLLVSQAAGASNSASLIAALSSHNAHPSFLGDSDPMDVDASAGMLPVAGVSIPTVGRDTNSWRRATSIDQWEIGDPSNGLTALEDWPPEYYTGAIRLVAETLYGNRRTLAMEYQW
ncbi:hypothetical protein B0H11DRAFT_1931417 [Mycena galericulata]|nr:hypothetical protein B0H11DRAFT_1931417 [Mycena galericulata]